MLPQVDLSPESADRLIATLEAQMASSRSKRAKAPAQRMMVLAGGLFFLLLVSAGALYFLFQMAMDLPRHTPAGSAQGTALTQP